MRTSKQVKMTSRQTKIDKYT